LTGLSSSSSLSRTSVPSVYVDKQGGTVNRVRGGMQGGTVNRVRGGTQGSAVNRVRVTEYTANTNAIMIIKCAPATK
jgi:hypothetical protein